ncbi:MAG: response regulator [Desulfobacteraceae bacterium]|nr:response regulator [Desulfobacteraceae bacterium]
MQNISLENKNVLIADDEIDVLDSLEELLTMCNIARAQSFEEANNLLETQEFDIAILDIMGVDGYRLLEIANKKNVAAVMLTAHALSPKNIKKSYLGGACSYIPKEEMINIDTFLIDVLTAKKEGRNTWTKWLERLGSYCESNFGPDWQDEDEDFWTNFKYLY